MNAIVFLTVNPVKAVSDFAKLLKRPDYNILICIDNNSYILPIYEVDLITIIKIPDGVAERNGFKNSVSYTPNRSCSRDKALYYLCVNNMNLYNNIWMIEEDVFIPSVDTIYNIDLKYPKADLLCRSNFINTTGELKSWDNYKKIVNKIQLPWCHSMVCAVRISNTLLDIINKFVKIKNELLFCETFFNTLAYHNNLLIIPINELSWIKYNNRNDLDLTSYNRDYLYHPIKDIQQHVNLRVIHGFI